jgi:dTDP-4-amino-4,6-dideoxygalactose transaminase
MSPAHVSAGQLPAVQGGPPALPERLPFIRPLLPPLAEVLAHYQTAYSNRLVTNGDCVAKFEGAAAEAMGVKHCVAVSSCTSGLTLVLRALGLLGDVILPSFTFFATGHAVRWNGLRPVFADCHPQNWTIDPADVERKITSRTSAILAVHLYGNPSDIDSLTKIATRNRLKLIFDAAHAFGSCYQGRPIGQFGNAEVFSLSPTKLLVAGEGGLVATNDAILAKSLRALRNYGDAGTYDPEWLGANARMAEFNAALGLAGLPMLQAKVHRRTQIAGRYENSLRGLPGLRFQQVRRHDAATFKDFCVHVTPSEFGLSRDEIGAMLLAENIETRKYFYPPLHRQKLYRSYHDSRSDPLPETERISAGILSLPIYESLADETVDLVSQAIVRLHAYGRTETNSGERRVRHADSHE